MLHNKTNVGSHEDLAVHRFEVVKEDLDTAKGDFRGSHFRAENNRANYANSHLIIAVLVL